jgi:predicted metal-dependent hydrolase
MDEAFLGGARLFDAGRFFEAHEAWEKHWLVETDETRRQFLQGLIQIAAGFHKLYEKNAAESAERLFTRGLAKLEACPSVIEELQLAAFCERIRTRDFDRAAIPKLDHAHSQTR